MFDHGANLPVEKEFKSVLTGEFPTTYLHESQHMKQKLGHLPSKIFGLMRSLLDRLEEGEDVSEYRILRIILMTMSFCFNFKPRNANSSLSMTDHFKRMYGLHRIQKPRTYPYVISEFRCHHEFTNRLIHAFDYSNFTADHLTYLNTLIHYGQSPFTKVRKMAQSMFRLAYKSSWLINMCGSHIDGRQNLFLSNILTSLEEQTAEKFYDGTDFDDGDDNEDNLG